MLTNADRGEANIFLAASRALFDVNPSVEIHFACFPGLEADTNTISEDVRTTNPGANSIVYHVIKGLSMKEGIAGVFAEKNAVDEGCYLPRSFMKPLSFGVTKQTLRDVAPVFVPYSGPQLVEVLSSIVDIINQVSPDITVVDSLMTPGLTACWKTGVNFTCLSPNSFKDFAGPLQPRGASIWKYPAYVSNGLISEDGTDNLYSLMSGYPFPVPWHLIPANIFISIYAIAQLLKDKGPITAKKHLQDTTGTQLRTPVDLLRNRPDWLKILIGSMPELDFPLETLPSHLLGCGPIILPAPAIADCSPELAAWLARGPTIYINLGSICKVSASQAVEMAAAIKKTLDALCSHAETEGLPRRHQVIWKLQKSGDYKTTEPGSEIYKILGNEISAGRVRIVSWIDTAPYSILKSGHVACSIHHGGANSFNEAVL